MRLLSGSATVVAAVGLAIACSPSPTHSASAERSALAERLAGYVEVQGMLENGFEGIEEVLARNPFRDPEMDAWFRKAMNAAAEKEIPVFTQKMRDRVQAALAAEFDEEDLRSFIEFEEYVRRPHIAPAVSEADKQEDLAGWLRFLKSKLPEADYRSIERASTSSSSIKKSKLLQQSLLELTESMTLSFLDSVKEHCDTAPKGVALCETDQEERQR
jgi:hypothetical protein